MKKMLSIKMNRHIFAGITAVILIAALIWGKAARSRAETIQDTEAGFGVPAEPAGDGEGAERREVALEPDTEAETRELTPEEIEEQERLQAAKDVMDALGGSGTDETMAGLGSDGDWLVDEPLDGGWSLSTPAPFSMMIRFDRDYEMLTEGQTGNWRRKYKGHYLWNDDALYEWFGKLKEKYDTEPGVVHFTTHDGLKLTFQSTNCGWQMNLDLTVLRLKEYAGLGEEIMDPVWNSGLVYSSTSDVGTKYVEVDIARQKVYLFEEGQLLLESDCVTGTRDWTDTTTGVYQVEYKASPAVLKDKDPNGNKYEQPVEYWISFNHSQGLHDAVWRGEFGGEIYKSWGSHGCVNLPLETAEKIYKEVYNYYPVIVYDTTRENIPDADTGADTGAGAGTDAGGTAGLDAAPNGGTVNGGTAGLDAAGDIGGNTGTSTGGSADTTAAAGTYNATNNVVGADTSAAGGTDIGAGTDVSAAAGTDPAAGTDAPSTLGTEVPSDLDFPGGVLF